MTEQNAELVSRLYQAILRRPVDPKGLSHYRSELDKGRSVSSVVEELMGSQEFGGSLFVPPGHFYSPIVNPRQATSYLSATVEKNRSAKNLPNLNIDYLSMVALWQKFLPVLREQPFSAHESKGKLYHFENPAYSWADGLILHSMLKTFKPASVVEIGCGWSSACLLDTAVSTPRWKPNLTFIDPYPALAEGFIKRVPRMKRDIKVIGSAIQDVSLDVFKQLQSGDFLFIDSTHVVKTGSDVVHELFEILPLLKPGVIVHFHDVFWPFEYPDYWVIDENRSWNELYILRAYLEGRKDWKILFFNDYFARHARAEIQNSFPDFLRNTGGSLWMQKQ